MGPPHRQRPADAPPPRDLGAAEQEAEEEARKPQQMPVEEPKGPPKPETPWERGLRQAKEVRLGFN